MNQMNQMMKQTVEPNAFAEKTARKWLKDRLRDGCVTVEFVKKDESLRRMKGTLAESRIPEEKRPKTEKKSKKDESLAVFDVEAQDWRSFRWDSVKAFEFNLDGE